MVNVVEGADAKQGIAANLAVGVNTLSLNQTITFTKYTRLVLPLDGFVFWVRADLLSKSALINVSAINAFAMNQPQKIVTPAPTVTVQGSLHYATTKQQNEDETPAVNEVIFTALSEVQDFQEIGPNTIFIATFQDIQFAFSQRRSFYTQADTYHYVGTAVLPAMQSQIIDAVDGFDSRDVVVSNSLPAWLYLSGYQPTLPSYGFGNPIQLYPSYAVPDNAVPPYGAVHIEPQGTAALASVPYLSPRSSHYQLAKDRVRVTLYGARNIHAQNFVDCVLQYSTDYGDGLSTRGIRSFGLMNMPIVRDEKRTQAELGILAMKKVIDFEVSYHQTQMRDVARQLILEAFTNYYPQENYVWQVWGDSYALPEFSSDFS